MTNRSEPVKNTCPLIDGVIDDLKEVVGTFTYYLENISDSGMCNNDIIRDMESSLYTVAAIIDRNGAMEELRAANDALRSWGNSLVEDLEELEKSIDL